jgi:uncharacterized peroxidase-related enzyme
MRITTDTTTGERGRRLAERARALYGIVPTTISVMRTGTATAEAYLSLAELNASSTLDALEREYIAITIASRNRCCYCLAGHSARALALGADAETINAIRQGKHVNARVDALIDLATVLAAEHGHIDDHALSRARERGLDDTTMLDVLTVVAENTLGNMVNNLSQTQPEPEILQLLHRRGVRL